MHLMNFMERSAMEKTNKPSVPTSQDNQNYAQLHQEIHFLRTRFDQLMSEAHHNQEILSRHQALDLKLIGSGSLRELLEHLFVSLAETSELDQVSLALLSHQNYLQEMMEQLEIDVADFPHLRFFSQEKELALPDNFGNKALLTPYVESRHQQFFSSHSEKPASLVLLPLVRHEKLFGYLGLGSLDAQRFTPDLATDFVERLASIISICLETVINSERLRQIGLTDSLTNISNRRYVEKRTLEEITRARRQEYTIACLYLDLDFFKHINDQYGHQCGDEVLKEVAKRIKAELRLSDTLGRFGGEEFVAILVNTDLTNAILVAQRIRHSIANHPIVISSDEGSCSITISIGVAQLKPQANHGDVKELAYSLLSEADHALYQAKEQGRNRVCAAP
jgi:two-component system cell cycle response regulator